MYTMRGEFNVVRMLQGIDADGDPFAVNAVSYPINPDPGLLHDLRKIPFSGRWGSRAAQSKRP